jgi:hypothetical protein
MSAYEQLRKENMARNQAMLLQLGLSKNPPSTPKPERDSGIGVVGVLLAVVGSHKCSASEMPAPVVTKRKDTEEAPPILRRSSRKKLNVEEEEQEEPSSPSEAPAVVTRRRSSTKCIFLLVCQPISPFSPD